MQRLQKLLSSSHKLLITLLIINNFLHNDKNFLAKNLTLIKGFRELHLNYCPTQNPFLIIFSCWTCNVIIFRFFKCIILCHAILFYVMCGIYTKYNEKRKLINVLYFLILLKILNSNQNTEINRIKK